MICEKEKKLRSVSGFCVVRRPLALSLWKRPGDFRPIRDELLNSIANFVATEKVAGFSPTPDQIQRFLIGLQDHPNGIRGMHWMFSRFDELFRGLVAKLKGPLAEVLVESSTVVVGTGKTLFGDLGGLRIVAGEGKPPIDILEVSSALKALQKTPNEIGYFVFVVSHGIGRQKLASENKCADLRADVVEKLFYPTLNDTIGDFLKLCPEKVHRIWPEDEIPDEYPRIMFESLTRGEAALYFAPHATIRNGLQLGRKFPTPRTDLLGSLVVASQFFRQIPGSHNDPSDLL